MSDDGQVHTLEFLLAFDGRVHWYAQGYCTRFVIRRVAPTSQRPHGLNYTLTLHGPEGERIMGFDNAHTVAARSRHAKRQVAADHWHRTGDDPGRAYAFTDAATLIADFFAEVERTLTERRVSLDVVREETTNQRSDS